MAAKIKENIKGIKALQERLIQRKKEIKKHELEAMGFEVSSKKIQIRNLNIEKDIFFDVYNISVIDKNKDLDGNLITQNQNLLHRIKVLWEAGKKEFPFSELYNFNILPLIDEIKIGNILLSNYLGIDKSYDISLIDKEKNIDNKWIDASVNMKRVLDVIMDFKYDKKMLELAEVPLNKELELYFKNHFESVKKK